MNVQEFIERRESRKHGKLAAEKVHLREKARLVALQEAARRAKEHELQVRHAAAQAHAREARTRHRSQKHRMLVARYSEWVAKGDTPLLRRPGSWQESDVHFVAYMDAFRATHGPARLLGTTTFSAKHRPTTGHAVGWVYFVRAHCESSLIKVGFTAKPFMRMSTLQGNSPSKLKLEAVVPALQRGELLLHELLHDQRAHCGWFQPNYRLLTLLQDAKRGVWLRRDINTHPLLER